MAIQHQDADKQIANKALNKIVSFNHNRGLNKSDRLPESGLLFHYTTAEGLKGIIEQNELWASSAYFLNDSAEITYGYGVLKQVLDQWILKPGDRRDVPHNPDPRPLSFLVKHSAAQTIQTAPP
jgi:hypothetical protein